MLARFGSGVIPSQTGRPVRTAARCKCACLWTLSRRCPKLRQPRADAFRCPIEGYAPAFKLSLGWPPSTVSPFVCSILFRLTQSLALESEREESSTVIANTPRRDIIPRSVTNTCLFAATTKHTEKVLHSIRAYWWGHSTQVGWTVTGDQEHSVGKHPESEKANWRLRWKRSQVTKQDITNDIILYNHICPYRNLIFLTFLISGSFAFTTWQSSMNHKQWSSAS